MNQETEEEFGFRMSILYQKTIDLSEEYKSVADGRTEVIAKYETVKHWYEQAIKHWCRSISEAAVNAGCQDILTEQLETCQYEVDTMNMMFDSSTESPFA